MSKIKISFEVKTIACVILFLPLFLFSPQYVSADAGDSGTALADCMLSDANPSDNVAPTVPSLECPANSESVYMDSSFITGVINKGLDFAFVANTSTPLTITISSTNFEIRNAKWVYFSGVSAELNNPNMAMRIVANKYDYSFVAFQQTTVPGNNGARDPGLKNIEIIASQKISAPASDFWVEKFVYFSVDNSALGGEAIYYRKIKITSPGSGLGGSYVTLTAGNVEAGDNGRIIGGDIFNQRASIESDNPSHINSAGGSITIKADTIQVGNLRAQGFSNPGGAITLFGNNITTGAIVATDSKVGWHLYQGVYLFENEVFGQAGAIIIRKNSATQKIQGFKGGLISAIGVSPSDITIKAQEFVWVQQVDAFSGCADPYGATEDYSWHVCNSGSDLPASQCAIPRKLRTFCALFNPSGSVDLEADGAGTAKKGVQVGTGINVEANSNNPLSNTYQNVRLGRNETISGAGSVGTVKILAPNGLAQLGSGGIKATGFHSNMGPAVNITGKWIYVGGSIITSNVEVYAFPNQMNASWTGAGDITITSNGNAANNEGNIFIEETSGLYAVGKHPFAPDGGNVTISSANHLQTRNWGTITINTSGADLFRTNSGYEPGSVGSWSDIRWYAVDGSNDNECTSANPPEVINGYNAGIGPAGGTGYGDGPAGGDGGNVNIAAKIIRGLPPGTAASLSISAVGGNGSNGGRGGIGGYCGRYVSNDPFASPLVVNNPSITNTVPRVGLGGKGGQGGNGGQITVNAPTLSCFLSVGIDAHGGRGGNHGNNPGNRFTYYGGYIGDPDNPPYRASQGFFYLPQRTGTLGEYPFLLGTPNKYGTPVSWREKYCEVLGGWNTVSGVSTPNPQGIGGQGGNVSFQSAQDYSRPISSVSVQTQGGKPTRYPDSSYDHPDVSAGQWAPYPYSCSSAKTAQELKEIYDEVDAAEDAATQRYYTGGDYKTYVHEIALADYGDSKCCFWLDYDPPECYSGDDFNTLCRPKKLQTPCQTKGFLLPENQIGYVGRVGFEFSYQIKIDIDNGAEFSGAQARQGAFRGADGSAGGNGGNINFSAAMGGSPYFRSDGGRGGPGSTGQSSFVSQPGNGGSGGSGGSAGAVSVSSSASSVSAQGGQGGEAGFAGIRIPMNVVSSQTLVDMLSPLYPPYCPIWYRDDQNEGLVNVLMGLDPDNLPNNGTVGINGQNATPNTGLTPSAPSGGFSCSTDSGGGVPKSGGGWIVPPLSWDQTESQYGPNACCDGVDNDMNGLMDCQDPDCFSQCYVVNPKYLMRTGSGSMLDKNNGIAIEHGTHCCVDTCCDEYLGTEVDNDEWRDGANRHDLTDCRVTLPNTPPTADNLRINANYQCLQNLWNIPLSWDFHGPETDQVQTAYQVQVFVVGNPVPVIDSGQVNNNSGSYAATNLLPNTLYTWQLKVWDNGVPPMDSGWIQGPAFTTDPIWPRPEFQCNGQNCGTLTPTLKSQENNNVDFTNLTTECGVGGVNCSFLWTFEDGNPATSAVFSPTPPPVKITPGSGKTSVSVSLKATDKAQPGRTCTKIYSLPVGAQLGLPKWIEIPPF